MNRPLLVLLIALALAGCASRSPMDRAQPLLDRGDYEAAIEQLEAQAGKGSVADRAAALRVRDMAVSDLLRQAAAASAQGDDAAARALIERAGRIDPTQPSVGEALRRLDDRVAASTALVRARERIAADDLDAASSLLRNALDRQPDLNEARMLQQQITEMRASRSTTKALDLGGKPITLQFRDAPIKQAFEAIGQATGLQFAFDKDVKQAQPITITLREVPVADALRVLTLSAQLDYKVLDSQSVLVYPRNPVKSRAYEDRVVRVFHLNSALAKDIAATLKSTFRVRDVYSDDKLNLVILRDTPAVVQMAERLILLQDVAEPEVMLEVEVLEVARARLEKIGFDLPKSVGLGAPNTDVSGTTSNSPPTLGLNGPFRAFIGNPAVVLNLRQRDASVDLLANPRIRVKNRSKARIHIGEKVPVITSNATANGVISGSVNYLDVGLKLDVEPAVHLDGDVSLGVRLEVSNIIEQVTLGSSSAGTTITSSSASAIAYRLGTRNTETNLRLKDGETQVIAGLIQDEQRRSREKLPLLASLPLIGRLFSTDGGDGSTKNKTEVILLITPRVLRNVTPPDRSDARFVAAPDTSMGNAAGVSFSPIEEPLLEPPSVAPEGPVAVPQQEVAPPPATPVPSR